MPSIDTVRSSATDFDLQMKLKLLLRSANSLPLSLVPKSSYRVNAL